MKNFNLISLTMLLGSTVFFMSCQPNNNNSGAGRCDNRNAVGCTSSNLTTQSNSDIVPQGRFLGTDQNMFQTYAMNLAAATIPQEALGTVSDGQVNDNTGIVFGAKVSLSNGTRVTAGGANSPILTTSRMLVAIYDSIVGQQTSTGQVIGPILIPMSSATGTAGGGVANVTFNDNYGTINYSGTYDSNTFTGTVTFTNNTTINGGQTKGNFQFQIPTCSFFVCN